MEFNQPTEYQSLFLQRECDTSATISESDARAFFELPPPGSQAGVIGEPEAVAVTPAQVSPIAALAPIDYGELGHEAALGALNELNRDRLLAAVMLWKEKQFFIPDGGIDGYLLTFISKKTGIKDVPEPDRKIARIQFRETLKAEFEEV